jgi:hypothetical protein
MKSIYVLILVLIIMYFLVKNQDNFTILDDNSSIIEKDKKYLQKFKEKKLINLVSKNKNKNNNSSKKNNKISIITFDNRKNIPYILSHNENLRTYSKKWGLDYKFIDNCSYNTYWCKIHMVLDDLRTGKYDYVMWMDSDTFIFNLEINLSNILNSYSSDIFIGLDNHKTYDFVNAGVFIIKNSPFGIQFLNECITSLNPECITNDSKSGKKLKGAWAGTCYEQGIMNILIADKYFNNTTVLPNDIIYNYGSCNKEVFIMHLYGSSNDTRAKCFSNK